MTVFSVIVALLVVMTLVVILRPLLRKSVETIDDRREQNIAITRQELADLEESFEQGKLDPEAYEEAKGELEQGLYDDLQAADDLVKAQGSVSNKMATALVAILIPVAALGMYSWYGNPLGIEESKKKGMTEQQVAAGDIQSMLVQLENKLKTNPDNLDGWKMLGRTYSVMNRVSDSISAYEKALAMAPDDPEVLLPLADVLARNNNKDLTGRPQALIQKALISAPDDPMGLWLAGMAASQTGDNPQAVKHWSKLVANMDPAAEERESVINMIREAGGDVSAFVPNVPNASEKPPEVVAATGSQPGIEVTVDLDETFKSQVTPGHSVFIYAKAMSGPPMPLAAARKKVSDLPITLILDDSMAMMPQLKLSAFPEVKVGARVSMSGVANAAAGDLYTEQVNVKPGATLQLLINRKLN